MEKLKETLNSIKNNLSVLAFVLLLGKGLITSFSAVDIGGLFAISALVGVQMYFDFKREKALAEKEIHSLQQQLNTLNDRMIKLDGAVTAMKVGQGISDQPFKRMF